MSLSYSLIQYIEDPVRNEGRNIGIIVQGFGEACFRALGVNGDNVDVTPFEDLSSRNKENGWVYREWIDWFNDVFSGRGKGLDHIQTISRKLEGGNIVIRDGGVIDTLSDDSLDEAADELYSRMVSRPTRQTAVRFSDRINEFIKKSEISFRPGFEKDISIEFLPDLGTPVSIALPFALLDKPRTAFKLVNPKGSIDSLLRQINDAVFTFETVVANGFAEKNRCVVITDKVVKAKVQHLNRLSAYAQIIYLSDSDAVSKAKEIIGDGAIQA
jgi:hypothetical protein